MSDNSQEPITDSDNPEWTEADFRRASVPAAKLPADILAQFAGTGHSSEGPAAEKVSISLELSAEVVTHFKATGPGWQARIDEALKRSIAK